MSKWSLLGIILLIIGFLFLFYGWIISPSLFFLLIALVPAVASVMCFNKGAKSNSTNATEKPYEYNYPWFARENSPELSNPPPPPPLPTKSPYELKIEKANWMREHPEPAEQRMLEILNSSVTPKFPKHPFYSQSLQYGYTMDFYCPTLKLAIEVDGSSHNNKRGYDWERQAHLERRGIQVFRASNDEVFGNPQGLVDSLCKIIQDKNQQLQRKENYSTNRYDRGGYRYKRYPPRRY